MINSVFRTGKNYYPEVFLVERKYVVKEKKIPNYVIDDIEISSYSDSDQEILMKKIQMEKNSSTEENSDEEILKKSQMKKNFDDKNSEEENSDKEN